MNTAEPRRACVPAGNGFFYSLVAQGSIVEHHWWLDTRDKPGLLWAFMQQFVDRATLSLEGSLQELGLEAIPGAKPQETEIARCIARGS